MNDNLELLLVDGIVDEIVSRLKSGKEADVWLVRHGGELIAAKLYKERATRSFKNNAGYTEGRRSRNSRTQRAIDKGSRFGQQAAEDAWKSAEADSLYKLHAAGVRVPTPVMFYEGVLLMELILGADGQTAPRLIDVSFTAAEAGALYADLRSQIVKMLCCDLIHGDLSPYNVLHAASGPTIIDFPQTVAAAANSQAAFYFRRDFENIRQFLAGFDRSLLGRAGDVREIWRTYERRELTPDFEPTGKIPDEPKKAAPNASELESLLDFLQEDDSGTGRRRDGFRGGRSTRSGAGGGRDGAPRHGGGPGRDAPRAADGRPVSHGGGQRPLGIGGNATAQPRGPGADELPPRDRDVRRSHAGPGDRPPRERDTRRGHAGPGTSPPHEREARPNHAGPSDRPPRERDRRSGHAGPSDRPSRERDARPGHAVPGDRPSSERGARPGHAGGGDRPPRDRDERRGHAARGDRTSGERDERPSQALPIDRPRHERSSRRDPASGDRNRRQDESGRRRDFGDRQPSTHPDGGGGDRPPRRPEGEDRPPRGGAGGGRRGAVPPPVVVHVRRLTPPN